MQTAATEHPSDLLERQSRVDDVLKHVARDYQVDAIVGKCKTAKIFPTETIYICTR